MKRWEQIFIKFMDTKEKNKCHYFRGGKGMVAR